VPRSAVFTALAPGRVLFSEVLPAQDVALA
jgi:hypothetical protein